MDIPGDSEFVLETRSLIYLAGGVFFFASSCFLFFTYFSLASACSMRRFKLAARRTPGVAAASSFFWRLRYVKLPEEGVASRQMEQFCTFLACLKRKLDVLLDHGPGRNGTLSGSSNREERPAVIWAIFAQGEGGDGSEQVCNGLGVDAQSSDRTSTRLLVRDKGGGRVEIEREPRRVAGVMHGDSIRLRGRTLSSFM